MVSWLRPQAYSLFGIVTGQGVVLCAGLAGNRATQVPSS